MTIGDCRFVQLPKNDDPRGSLTVIENQRHIPFAMERLFYTYDVPGGAERGGHALKTCEQFLIAMSGSFDAMVDDGTERKRYRLSQPHVGRYIPPMIWREMENFSEASVCLAVASTMYIASNYYRDYQGFIEATQVRMTLKSRQAR